MRKPPRRFKTSFRYTLYRLQQRVAITSQEAKALAVVLVLLLLGILARAVQQNTPAFSDEIYAETDSLFEAATAGDTLPTTPSDSLLDFFRPRFPVNINTATRAELEHLPRIGPSMAGRIIAYRERYGAFTAKTDLMRVKGIGEKTYAGLEDKITTR